MSWNGQLFMFKNQDADREELRRLVAERDKKLKEQNVKWKTIITETEMADRKRLGMDCREYITYTDFKKKCLLENRAFIHTRKTLAQELEDKNLFNSSTVGPSEKEG